MDTLAFFFKEWSLDLEGLSRMVDSGQEVENMSISIQTDAEAETPMLGHLMRRVDSLEKTPMLGRIGGRRRRGQQRVRWLDASLT